MIETNSRLKLHLCQVTKIYDSGLLDLKGVEIGHVFKEVNISKSGIEEYYAIGDLCVLLSDGTQKYVIGKVNYVQRNIDGENSIKDLEGSLSKIPGAKGIIATDEFGNQSKILVVKGAGVLIDSGELSGMHFDAANGKILSFSERKEESMPGYYMYSNHDSTNASSTYIWRTSIDENIIESDMLGIFNHEDEAGSVLRIDIYNDGLFMLKQYQDGDLKYTFNIDTDGIWRLTHSQENTYDEEYFAMAKKSHEMLLAAMDTILDFQWIDSMGTPHSLRTDPLFGASNVEARDDFDEEYGTTDDPLIAFKKLVLTTLP